MPVMPHVTPAIAARAGHAVVIGGSICGMMAARVLADHFERVTILERDPAPEGPVHRAGTPQARHAHGLLKRGQQVMEQLFPGLGDELIAHGACVATAGGEFRICCPAGWMLGSPRELLLFSRGLLEWTMRRRALELPHVQFVTGARVKALLPGERAHTVAGVLRSFTRDGGESEALRAELVVDASGRGSNAPQWLTALGYQAPPEEIVDSHMGYASRVLEPPAGWNAPWKGLLVQAAPPAHPCGGALFRIEGGRWMLSLFGGARCYPPTDDEGLLAFARNLRTPAIYEAIKDARPLSPVYGFRDTINRLRHFERLTRLPDGFIALGDAVCTFNPVYGQGMTVAAVGVELLQRRLQARATDAARGLAGLPAEFARELAAQLTSPWSMATGEDMRFDGVEGGDRGAVARGIRWYLNRVQRLTVCRPAVSGTFIDVVQMLAPPTALFQPALLASVLFDPAARAPTNPRY